MRKNLKNNVYIFENTIFIHQLPNACSLAVIS